MHRTRVGELLAPLIAVAAIGYALLRTYYGSLPPLQYSLVVPLAALAGVELVAARRVRSAVRHVPEAKPMTAIAIARCVALGKASALVGAALVGLAVALLARIVPDVGDVRAARADLGVAIGLAVATLALVAAGLTLERAGVDPGAGRPDPPQD